MFLFPSYGCSRGRCPTSSCFAGLRTKSSVPLVSVAPKPSTTSIAADVTSLDSISDTFYSELYILQRIAEAQPYRVIAEATTGFRKRFKFGKKLGAGAYGKVLLCKRRRDGNKFAVKCIPKRRLLAACESAERRVLLIRALRNEVAVLRLASAHTNVASMCGVYEDNEHLFLVLEHCAGGELFEQLVADGSMNEATTAAIIKQLCAVLKFLHEKCGIVHCDLKPENILLAGTHSLKIQLVDFGMAHILERGEFLSIPGGSPMYTAPEVIETVERKSRYAQPCDMWSLGVIIFVMLFKFPPFFASATESKGKSAHELRHVIYRKVLKGFKTEVLPVGEFGYGPWFPDLTPTTAAARDLISRLLCLDASKRLTAAQALDHVWLRGRADGGHVVDKSGDSVASL